MGSKLTIEPATPADESSIREFSFRVWLTTYPNAEHGITAADIEEYWRRRDATRVARRRARGLQRTLRLVARADDEMVGVCRLLREAKQNELVALNVRPDYWGRGIGQSFWAMRQRLFDPLNPTKVRVVGYNERAIAFYRKLGFEDRIGWVLDEQFRMPSGRIMPLMEMRRLPDDYLERRDA